MVGRGLAPLGMTHKSRSHTCPYQTMTKCLPSSTMALYRRPLYADVMTTSPSASNCGGCAPVSHQTVSALMLSSLAKACATPASVDNTSYTLDGGTPSAIKAHSRFTRGDFRKPRLPGYFFVSKKSLSVV